MVTVVRGGEVSFVDAAFITIGDIVKLEQGDLVPADIRVLECSPNMCVDNSSLDGRKRSDQAQAGMHPFGSAGNGQPVLLRDASAGRELRGRGRQDCGQHRASAFSSVH